MDLIVPTSHTHEGLRSFQYFNRYTTRRSSFAGARIRGNDGSSRKVHVGFRKLRKSRVFAVSGVETFRCNGKLQNLDKPLNGHMGNGHVSSSSIEEFESNNHLRKLVRNGELEEGFRFLENMVYRGEIPDIIASTSLIRGFCKIGKTRKATRIMEIIEDSGAVPDVITYNVLISGYCKAGEIDNALRVLDRMSVAPDVVTYNTILRTLCDSGKLKQAMEVLDRQLEKECYPDVITYTILIEATCAESGVGQADRKSVV